MSAKVIAVAGKGGTGKTTTSSLMIRELVKRGESPIIGVDADPNSNLAESFAAEPENTIGSMMATFMDNRLSLPPGMTKDAYLELKIEETLEETEHVDFLVMGRKEGTGCYCAPNTILKNYIAQLVESYKFVMVDNEAGLEHLSRKTLEKIHAMVLVSDHSVKGLRAVCRIRELVSELDLDVRSWFLVVNRYREEDAETLAEMIESVGVPPERTFNIPNDPAVIKADAMQQSFHELPDSSPAVQAVSSLIDNILAEPAIAAAR